MSYSGTSLILSDSDTSGAEGSVLYCRVGLKCIQEWYLWREKLERCPQFRVSLGVPLYISNKFYNCVKTCSCTKAFLVDVR